MAYRSMADEAEALEFALLHNMASDVRHCSGLLTQLVDFSARSAHIALDQAQVMWQQGNVHQARQETRFAEGLLDQATRLCTVLEKINSGHYGSPASADVGSMQVCHYAAQPPASRIKRPAAAMEDDTGGEPEVVSRRRPRLDC